MHHFKLAIAASVAGLAMLLPTSPAQAGEYDNATECRGKIIENVPFRLKNNQVNRTEGELFGHLQFYYSEAENLYCAVMYHGGPTWDTPLLTGVRLYKYNDDGNNEVDNDTVGERDVFRFQAGPKGSRGYCMQAGGSIQFKGAYRTLYTYRYKGTKRVGTCA